MLSFIRYLLTEAVSKSTLEYFKDAAVKHARDVFGGRSKNCQGTCSAAAWALHQHLKSQGKDSHYVVGSYHKSGKHPEKFDQYNQHAWVVHHKKILDVTHNQFDSKTPINTANHNDHRYKEHKRDEAAYKSVQNWDPQFKASKKNLTKYYAAGEK